MKTLIDQTGADTLVFTGISGMAIGFPIARALKLRPVVVRKTVKGTHGCHKVEMGGAPEGKFIIIDDRIETGKTIRRVLKEIETYCHWYYRYCSPRTSQTKYVGIVLYDNQGEGSSHFKTRSASIPVYYVI